MIDILLNGLFVTYITAVGVWLVAIALGEMK